MYAKIRRRQQTVIINNDYCHYASLRDITGTLAHAQKQGQLYPIDRGAY